MTARYRFPRKRTSATSGEPTEPVEPYPPTEPVEPYPPMETSGLTESSINGGFEQFGIRNAQFAIN